jgi:heme exporter protein A
MIKTQDLTKSFGARVALAGITLHIKAGEFVWLIGPNGAGKTTLMRILATLTPPSSGTLSIAGLDAHSGANAMTIRHHIGFLSHRTWLYDDLSVAQNLAFYAQLYHIPDSPARIGELLERLGLATRRQDLVRTLSRGMQQRLAIARAVLHRPSILLLDEAYTGLDASASQNLNSILNDLSRNGCTIILTAHNAPLKDREKSIANDELRMMNNLHPQPRIVTLHQGHILTEG